MGWESFGVVRFDIGPFVQGQMLYKFNTILLLLGAMCSNKQIWYGKRSSYRKNIYHRTESQLSIVYKVE